MTPQRMPAAVYVGDGEIVVRELDVPELGEHEALVEVSHCGICGTDLHLVLDRYARPNSVLGHEWAGTIAAVGPGVHEWELGARVVQNPTPGCGECRACLRGRSSVCLRREPPDLLAFTSGAFCRYKVVPSSRLLRVPDALSTRAAALTEPTAIAIHTVNLSGVTPDDRVLVTGGGPVGLLTTAVLRARGIDDITVSEPAPLRRERALAVGAARVIAPDALTRAPMGRPVAEPYTIAFECSGNASAAESAFDQLDYAGTLVFVGTGHEMPRINHNRAIVLELTIIAAYNYDIEGFGPALDLLASGRLPLDALIEADDVLLDDVLGTMHRLAAGELPGKVMVRPEVRGVTEPEFAPRLNHVAISMDPALLDDRGRTELLDFYGDVFGWTEGDNTGEIGNPLIMYTGAFGQFVYLLPGDPYLRAPAMDHFGVQVATLAQLEAIVARAKARQASDERVTLIDVHARTTQGPTHDYTLTSAYIGFVMPLLVELQHLERHER